MEKFFTIEVVVCLLCVQLVLTLISLLVLCKTKKRMNKKVGIKSSFEHVLEEGEPTSFLMLDIFNFAEGNRNIECVGAEIDGIRLDFTSYVGSNLCVEGFSNLRIEIPMTKYEEMIKKLKLEVYLAHKIIFYVIDEYGHVYKFKKFGLANQVQKWMFKNSRSEINEVAGVKEVEKPIEKVPQLVEEKPVEEIEKNKDSDNYSILGTI